MLRLLFLLLFLGTPCVAQTQTPLAQVEYGVICNIDLTGQEPAPETASGVINLIDQNREIDVITRQVPADIGVSFGMRTVLNAGASLLGARISVTHPPMGPSGTTRQSWSAPLRGGQSALNMYTFEEDEELVLGTWIFQLVFADNVLAEQVFQVLPSGSIAAVQEVCGGERLTS